MLSNLRSENTLSKLFPPLLTLSYMFNIFVHNLFLEVNNWSVIEPISCGIRPIVFFSFTSLSQETETKGY